MPRLRLTIRIPSRERAIRAAEAAWDAVEEPILDKIRKRTAKGVSLDGTKFEPYSPGYAAQRQREGLQKRPVNLRRTGKMLDDRLDVLGRNVEGGRITVGVRGDRAIVAKYVGQKRPFLGLTSAELKDIGKLWVKTFTRSLFGRSRGR